jgi:anti-sigma regulatory factor (Ser/Thr protein kinase)
LNPAIFGQEVCSSILKPEDLMSASTPTASITLSCDLEAPRRARAFLQRFICADVADRSDEAQLLVSELVTNAVRHGSPPLTLELDCNNVTGLEVRVTDGSKNLPVKTEAAELNALMESGRGVQLVDLLSDDWNIEPRDNGKTVWFALHPIN